jgi:hypothetical protein
MKKIADVLSAYYFLGYYTTNTKFDGQVRKITVRTKSNGKSIRARLQYRAPTEAEIAALALSSSPAGASGPAAPAGAPAAVTPREAALTVLERASRPFVPYVAAAGKSLTVVAELSSASIQAGRWKDGAAVEVQAIGSNGEPLVSAKGRIEAGSYSVAIPLTVGGVWPSRVTVALSAAGERPAEDWIKLEPPSGALVGEAVASRAARRGRSPRSSSRATSACMSNGPCSRRSIAARFGCSIAAANRCPSNCPCPRIPPRRRSSSTCRSRASRAAITSSNSPPDPARPSNTGCSPYG